MKVLLSTLNSLIVGGCAGALMWFCGVNLDKKPWWSWAIAGAALVVSWESAKAGIAKAVVDKMNQPVNIEER